MEAPQGRRPHKGGTRVKGIMRSPRECKTLLVGKKKTVRRRGISYVV